MRHHWVGTQHAQGVARHYPSDLPPALEPSHWPKRSRLAKSRQLNLSVGFMWGRHRGRGSVAACGRAEGSATDGARNPLVPAGRPGQLPLGAFRGHVEGQQRKAGRVNRCSEAAAGSMRSMRSITILAASGAARGDVDNAMIATAHSLPHCPACRTTGASGWCRCRSGR